MPGNLIKLSTLYPFLIRSSHPFKSKRLITKKKQATFAFEISISFAAASAVPPVAIKSSIIRIFSLGLIES